eukprot:TCONS_00039541-protein
MKNHLIATIGGLYKSVFYWCNVNSLEKLKERIEIRFHIPTSIQNISCNGNILDEVSYEQLYKGRFVKNIDLDVEFSGGGIDRDMVKKRRGFAAKMLDRLEISFHDSTRPESLDIDFDIMNIDSTISDLKASNQGGRFYFKEECYFVYKQHIILADEQLFADLYLDDVEKHEFSFKLRFMLKNRLNCDKEAAASSTNNLYWLSPHISIIFPGMKTSLVDEKKEHHLSVIPPKNEVSFSGLPENEFFKVGYTKVRYPLLEIGSFDVTDMKCWIEDTFGIPCEKQFIYRHHGRRTITIPSDILLNDWQTTAISYLFFVIIGNETEQFEPFDSKSHSERFPGNFSFVLSGGEDFNHSGVLNDNETIESYIEQNFKIPQNKQCLFYQSRRVEHDDLMVLQIKASWEHFLSPSQSNNRGKTYELVLASQANDVDFDLMEAIRELGIRHFRSIVIRHDGDMEVLCEFPFSEVPRKQTEQYQWLCKRIVQQHPKISPNAITLIHQGQSIKGNHGLEQCLLANDGEDLVLTMAISHYSFDISLEESSEEIKINFLGGQFTIYLNKEAGSKTHDINNVKREISKAKNIPPHLQTLLHEKEELADRVKLAQFQPPVELNLLLKEANIVIVRLSITFFECSRKPLKMKETDSVFDIKKKIEALSGVSHESMFVRRSGSNIEVNDDARIWTLNGDELFLTKKISFSIIEEEKMTTEYYAIENYDRDTVETLRSILQQRPLFSRKVMELDNREGFVSSTKLKDVHSTVIHFNIHSKSEKTKKCACNIS